MLAAVLAAHVQRAQPSLPSWGHGHLPGGPPEPWRHWGEDAAWGTAPPLTSVRARPRLGSPCTYSGGRGRVLDTLPLQGQETCQDRSRPLGGHLDLGCFRISGSVSPQTKGGKFCALLCRGGECPPPPPESLTGRRLRWPSEKHGADESQRGRLAETCLVLGSTVST